jgi:hypothetical protein
MGSVTAMSTFDSPEPIAVDLELGVGDVRIVASDRTDTIVDVWPSNPAKKADVTAAEGTRVECIGGRLLIKAPKGWKQWAPWRGGESIDVQIALPAGSRVHGDAAIAALHTSGRLGECRYRTSLGDIQVDQAGPVQLKTGGGDITVDRATDRVEVTVGFGAARIDSIDGTAVIKNSNGDTWIGEVTGDLQVNAANGRISVDHAEATVEAKTANGDVRVGVVIRGAILAQCGRGRIEVGVRDGVAAWLDLNARYGNVRSDLDATREPEQGEDTVEVRARTSYGDITISRHFANDIGEDQP